jgi:anthranilate phosphoribosyltransferase
MEFVDIVRIIGRGRKLQRHLTEEEATTAMRLMLSGAASQAQLGAFLVTMRTKEETAEELMGFIRGARQAMIPFSKPQVDGLLDIGIPYDGKAETLQTGAVAAMVVAAAGVPVVLHGADNIPTKYGVGVLNLLRALHYPVDDPPEIVSARVERTGFGVYNLARILPSWVELTPIRQQCGLRTLMNTVEKLFNPADAQHHISGFYHANYANRLAEVLPGSGHRWIIQGTEGSIDFRPGKKTRVYQAAGDHMVELTIDAIKYGFDTPIVNASFDVGAQALMTQSILDGQPCAGADSVAFAAGMLLWMVRKVEDVSEGVTIARSLLASGRVKQMLAQTVS